MRKKISVIGKGVEIAPELSRIASVSDDVRGADVVVLANGTDLAEIARCAPASCVVVVGDSLEERCQAAYEGTLFPRARIIGVPDRDGLDAVLESIVAESGATHDVIAMSDGQFGLRSARLSRGGIRAFA
jgi:hypothetical protein